MGDIALSSTVGLWVQDFKTGSEFRVSRVDVFGLRVSRVEILRAQARDYMLKRYFQEVWKLGTLICRS